MKSYTIAPSPFEDDPRGFFILSLGPVAVFHCQPRHHWPMNDSYLQFRIINGSFIEKWTVSIWHDNQPMGKSEVNDRKAIQAAWRWYKKHRKNMGRARNLEVFSLS